MLTLGMPGGPEMIILIAIVLPLIYVFTLIDIIRSQFESDMTKLIWVLVVIFMPLLGTLLYLAIGRGQRVNKSTQS